MVINFLKQSIVLCLGLLLSSQALAFDVIDEAVVFAKVVQGHHGDNNNSCHQISGSQLSINGSGRINGTGGDNLDFCSSNQGAGLSSTSCDGGASGSRMCTIDGTDIRGLGLTGNNAFKTSSGAGGSFWSCSNGQLSLGGNGQSQFDTLSLYSTCTVSFSASQTEYRFKKWELGSGAKIVLSAGDYWIDTLQLNQNAEIELQGDVRLFVRNAAQLNGAKVNESAASSLVVVAYNDFTLNVGSLLNGSLYSDQSVIMNNQSTINGAVTSRYLVMSDSTINAGARIASSQLQFGKATSTNVVFDTPFESGVIPLIFAMPTIDGNDPENDGPASVFVTQVTSSGFTWQQRQPVGSRQTPQQMTEVHWIAVTAGEHQLSDGSYIEAGIVNVSTPSYGNSENYQQVSMSRSYDVVLNQIQSTQNNCWLTSTAKWNNSSISVGIDVSEVVNAGSGNGLGNKRCQPEDIQLNRLNAETVAYLALKSGNGIIELDGKNVRYQFGSDAQTINYNSTVDLAIQCNYFTSLIGFENEPTLVAGKHSRNGNNGGWLRRCELTNAQVSMVTDEDQYQDSERNHIAERYGFVALEVIDDTPELGCFNDDFNRQDLGSDWAIKTLGSSVPPAINSQRMRITPASGNQATSSTFQRLFPAENNLVQIEFDYFAWSPSSGTGGDGVAIILSDAAITPQPGSFGGALGYAQRDNGTPGFKGGWLGVGLDEYGNFSNPNEGKNGGPGFRPQSVTIRGSEAAMYPYLAGTTANLNPRIDVRSTATAAPNHKYRLIVDSRTIGKAFVSLERDTGSGYQFLVAPFDARAISGQGAVPQDFYLSFTGSTGGANNNHEIDNFKVCALSSKPVGKQVHHFEFDYSSSPLTCKAETMAVRACSNAACNPLFTDPVTAQLSLTPNTNGAWYVGGVNTTSVNFVNGMASVDLKYNVTTPVTIGVSSSVPSTVAGSNTLCRKGSGALNTASCTLTFADSGFIFDVPDKLANKPQNVTISAVKKSDSSLQCVPAFANAPKSVGFWSSYISPATINPASVTVKDIGSTTIATSIGKSEASRTQVPLVFNASGVATMEVNYAEAGKLLLDARLDGVDAEAGLVMLGSDQFVNFPVGLCVTPKDSGALCAAGDVSCNVYRKAGQAFDLNIHAKAWQSDGDSDYCDNLNTSNYAHDAIILDSELVAPVAGVQGAVGAASYHHVAALNSQNTVAQSVSEVGVFKFTAKPPSSYLGSSFYDIPLAKSVNIGRFVPDRYVVTSSSVLPACGMGSFSYMDQPFPLAFDVTAVNVNDGVTQNYRDGFAKATGILVGENNQEGIDRQHRLNLVPLPLSSSSWMAGMAEIDYLPVFSRLTPLVGNESDGPYELMDVGIILDDQDGGITLVDTPDMNADTSDDCSVSSTSCNAKRLSATPQRYRHGRIVMDNTYGPETEVLRMPVRAEYWQGSQWVINSEDSCTTVSAADAGLATQVDDTLLGYVFAPALSAGQTINRDRSALAFANGEFSLLWQSVTSGGTSRYRGQVTAPFVVQDWLKWYWNWDGVSATTLSDPRASAFFGRYRGHDKIIYWREVN